MKFKSLHTLCVSAFLCLSVTACDDDEDEAGGNVCEQAADVLVNDCNFEVDGGSGGEEEPACEGDVAATAQCIVDHPAETCEAFEDLTEPVDNAYTDCVLAIGG